MEPSTQVEYSASSTPLNNSAFGIDIFSPILNLFSSFGGGVSGDFIDLLSTIWSIFAVISLLLSIVMLGLYIFASIRRWHYYTLNDIQLREAEALFESKVKGVNRNSRMDDIVAHIASENPNDWKLAIIEADVILDNLMKERGYAGASLGERLRSISTEQLSTLNDAWEAHKMRNMIAHEGADFVLTKRMAEETINRYRRVFTEFGIL